MDLHFISLSTFNKYDSITCFVCYDSHNLSVFASIDMTSITGENNGEHSWYKKKEQPLHVSTKTIKIIYSSLLLKSQSY